MMRKWTVIDPDGFTHVITYIPVGGVWDGWQNLPTEAQEVVTALYASMPLPEGYHLAKPE